VLREWERFPATQLKLLFLTPKYIFNFHSFYEEGWSSRSTIESKNQAEASHAAAKGGGKKCRAAKKAKLNSIPELEKQLR